VKRRPEFTGYADQIWHLLTTHGVSVEPAPEA